MKRWQSKYAPGSQHGNLLILAIASPGQTARDTLWQVRCLLCGGVDASARYRHLTYQKARCRDCYRNSVSEKNRARKGIKYAPRPRLNFVRVPCGVCFQRGCRLCDFSGYTINKKRK